MSHTFYAAIVAASLMILATALPLHLRETRQTAEDGDGDQLLSQIYTGLSLLYQISVYELKDMMNISSVKIRTENATNILFSSLDITCDLYTANTDLIPAIENLTYNTSPSTNVLNKIVMAGGNKSCLWLRHEAQVVNSEGARVNCSELSGICKRWSHIKKYEEAKSNIIIYKSSINSSAEIIENYQTSYFSSNDQVIISKILSSTSGQE